MATYFLDTSAIVKRYILEQGQSLLLDICDPEKGHDLYISQAAIVEVVATFCRKKREKIVTADQRDELINLFREDAGEEYGIKAVTTALYILLLVIYVVFINYVLMMQCSLRVYSIYGMRRGYNKHLIPSLFALTTIS